MLKHDPFTHFANVDFRLFKSGRLLIPYDIEDAEFDALPAAGDMDILENLDFVRFRMIGLPKEVEEMRDDQCAHIKAEFWGHFDNYETAYGTEYDADFELRNEVVTIGPITP